MSRRVTLSMALRRPTALLPRRASANAAGTLSCSRPPCPGCGSRRPLARRLQPAHAAPGRRTRPPACRPPSALLPVASSALSAIDGPRRRLDRAGPPDW